MTCNCRSPDTRCPDISLLYLGTARGSIAAAAPAAAFLSCPWEWEMWGFFGLRVRPADEVLKEIRAAQVSAVFRQMPIALAVNAVNAIITAVVLQQLVDFVLPLAWLCVVLLVTSGRWALWLRYRRVHSGVIDIAEWSWIATCGSLLAGMCW